MNWVPCIPRVEPCCVWGYALARVAGVMYEFVFDEKEPGEYVLRFTPGDCDYVYVHTHRDIELIALVDLDSGTVTALVEQVLA